MAESSIFRPPTAGFDHRRVSRDRGCFRQGLCGAGYDLALSARRLDRLEALAAELSAAHGIEAFAVPADLAEFSRPTPACWPRSPRGAGRGRAGQQRRLSIAQSFTGVPWSRQRDFLMTWWSTPAAWPTA